MALGFRSLGEDALGSSGAAVAPSGSDGAVSTSATVAGVGAATFRGIGAVTTSTAISGTAAGAVNAVGAVTTTTTVVAVGGAIGGGNILKIAPFFSTDTITTPGYKVQRIVGGVLTDDVAHTTAGILAIADVTNGYCAEPTLTLNDDLSYRGVIIWDSGGGSPFYVADEIFIPPGDINLTQATEAGSTLGEALMAARASGMGKITKSGTTLTVYKADGTTVLKSFTLDDGTNPQVRTPA